MGRQTFKSIGRPLPQRHNIVVTRDRSYAAEGCAVAHSVEGALTRRATYPEIAVIGGAQVFQGLLPQADILHITYIHAEIDGNTFFPPLNKEEWRRARARGNWTGAKECLPPVLRHGTSSSVTVTRGRCRLCWGQAATDGSVFRERDGRALGRRQ